MKAIVFYNLSASWVSMTQKRREFDPKCHMVPFWNESRDLKLSLFITLRESGWSKERMSFWKRGAFESKMLWLFSGHQWKRVWLHWSTWRWNWGAEVWQTHACWENGKDEQNKTDRQTNTMLHSLHLACNENRCCIRLKIDFSFLCKSQCLLNSLYWPLPSGRERNVDPIWGEEVSAVMDGW